MEVCLPPSWFYPFIHYSFQHIKGHRRRVRPSQHIEQTIVLDQLEFISIQLIRVRAVSTRPQHDRPSCLFLFVSSYCVQLSSQHLSLYQWSTLLAYQIRFSGSFFSTITVTYPSSASCLSMLSCLRSVWQLHRSYIIVGCPKLALQPIGRNAGAELGNVYRCRRDNWSLLPQHLSWFPM